MKKRFKLTSLFLLITVLVATSYAGTIKSRGTAGAYQLSIPVGARGIALNGANLGIVSGVEAIFYNPAGVSNMGGSVEAQFSNMTYIADIDVNYAAFVTKLGGFGTFGLSVKSLDFGDILRTSAENTEGTGETFSPNFITAGATWSKAFTDRINFGVNFKYVSEQILRTSASGISADLGVQYNFAGMPLQIGVVLKNLGSKMQYAGSDLEQKLIPLGSEEGTLNESYQIVSEGFEMPAELNISVSYMVIPGLSLMSVFQNNSFSNNELRFGGEYSLSFGSASAWAGGAIATGLLDDDQPDDIGNSDWDEYGGSIFGITFGAGVSYPVGNMVVSLEVAQRLVTDYFDNNMVWSLKLAF